MVERAVALDTHIEVGERLGLDRPGFDKIGLDKLETAQLGYIGLDRIVGALFEFAGFARRSFENLLGR